MRFCTVLLTAGIASAISLDFPQLFKRQNTTTGSNSPSTGQVTCSGLNAQSNNGDRKIAIVIDSSGSMSENDPTNLRITAGKAINDWLIAQNEVKAGQKVDKVTVVDFDDYATVLYPLGDPTGAVSTFDLIDSSGGTYIADGVSTAITQLTGPGSGSTKGRSGIVVLTDGEDSYTTSLVSSINRAASQGIRVSFGYLSLSEDFQDPSVLSAIRSSGGSYSTLADAAGVSSWVNSILVNGLTGNDNSQGANNIIFAGLSTTHGISGSHTDSLTYNAQNNENIMFTISSINAGALTAEALFGGKSLHSAQVSSYGSSSFNVTSPGNGEMTVKVSTKNAPKQSLYAVGAYSNLPISNCTVGIKKTNKDTGLSTAAKAGIGTAVPLGVALIFTGLFLLLKKFIFPPKAPPLSAPPQMVSNPHMSMPPPKPSFYPTVQSYPPPMYPPYSPPPQVWTPQPYGAPPPVHYFVPPVTPPLPSQAQNPQNKSRNMDHNISDCECSDPSDNEHEAGPHQPQPQQKHKHRFQRIKWKSEPKAIHHHHPVFNFGTECKDEKCPLNAKDHECPEQKQGELYAPCPCDCQDLNCPCNMPEEKRRRRREKLRREFRNSAFATGRSVVVGQIVHTVAGAI